MVMILQLSLWSCWYISAVHTTVEVVKVYFSSLNFYTALRWEAVCDVHPNCIYEVQYRVYGDRRWTNKTDCGEVKNACNMTEEMLMKEHLDENIYARVRAKPDNVTSSWKKSEEFQPLRDTNISAPAVSLTSSSNSIIVHITSPHLAYHIKYPDNKDKKEIYFSITISTLSKLLKTENTEENVWNITDLAPGNYCISVNMNFDDIRSSPSPKQCVKLKGLISKEVILGSILAVFASVVIVVSLAIYLILYRHLFHPKTHLPSNLILRDFKSKTSEYKSDETFMAPSIFEGMELSKYILESKEHAKEHPQNKRYISTEAWRKDYVNCRQKDIDQSVLLDKTVELRNSTYSTNASENSLQVEYPNVWISSQARYTKEQAFLHDTHIYKYGDHYNHLTEYEEYCRETKQSDINQDEELHFYINDQFPLYNNIRYAPIGQG